MILENGALVLRFYRSNRTLRHRKKENLSEEKRVQQLTEANRSSRLERSQALLDKFSEHEVEFIFVRKTV